MVPVGTTVFPVRPKDLFPWGQSYPLLDPSPHRNRTGLTQETTMPLEGDAKRDYQREYMRKKRAG